MVKIYNFINNTIYIILCQELPVYGTNLGYYGTISHLAA